jgi:hypothetical protein
MREVHPSPIACPLEVDINSRHENQGSESASGAEVRSGTSQIISVAQTAARARTSASSEPSLAGILSKLRVRANATAQSRWANPIRESTPDGGNCRSIQFRDLR